MPEVCSSLKKVRRAGVPERMSVKTKGKACRPPARPYHVVNGGGADAVAEAAQVESLFFRVMEQHGPPNLQVAVDDPDCFSRDGNPSQLS